ncbi:porin family protein [Capnocytophaga canimorsus]|uniref:Outer membrane protein beta-barrel domain-containing protein n=1 Tax=Capnocytophaga canimorsus TaxID=28188 RepID=A0A0B7IGX7_9FLAO|nr:outer membrane beta-barrel protein [Capnocytophaga canimorsus]ATA77891.1 hypothetical protein CGC47_10060 [Capnocytophaga canimorsus]ATA92542.1 hypothetical protein CGC56_10465 [Capnocytophaga canimorsus]ATA94686.1 hypothetical protein CGC54_10255 [Capnocytophaga canimorsus]AWL79377.1 hypothetical protein DKB58_10750 [Capnocytophaga canimorsus]AYW35951.1 hypothetical protein D8L92_00430 [Capnocytophaga canimorsus]
MKKIILFFGFLATITVASAQGTLEKGATQLNAGFGFSSWGIPVYVGLDYGIADDITIGGEISFRTDSKRYHETKVTYNGLGIGANGNYHFNRLLNLPNEFDFYAGVNLTYYNWTSNVSGGSYSGSWAYDSGLGWGLQTGGRYFFSNTFGVNLEFGLAGASGATGSGGKIGITYKF